MNKNLIYCVSAAILAMVFMLAGQANAQSGCEEPDVSSNSVTINCGSTDDDIEVFEDNGELFVDIGEGPVSIEEGLEREIVEKVLIFSGDGNDKVSIHDLAASFAIDIETGPGNDVVSVGHEVEADLLKIVTGSEKDEIHLGLNVLLGLYGLFLDACPGQDRLSTFAAVPLGFAGVVAVGDIQLFGGQGSGLEGRKEKDTIVIGSDSLTSDGMVLIQEWESFGTITE